MLCHHVSEEPDRKRNRTYEVSDPLDDKHQGSKPPDRPEKMLYVLRLVDLEPVIMGCEEDRDGTRGGCIDI